MERSIVTKRNMRKRGPIESMKMNFNEDEIANDLERLRKLFTTQESAVDKLTRVIAQGDSERGIIGTIERVRTMHRIEHQINLVRAGEVRG